MGSEATKMILVNQDEHIKPATMGISWGYDGHTTNNMIFGFTTYGTYGQLLTRRIIFSNLGLSGYHVFAEGQLDFRHRFRVPIWSLVGVNCQPSNS